jgi:hypothetical protein
MAEPVGQPLRTHGARLAGNIVGLIGCTLVAAFLWLLAIGSSRTGVSVLAVAFSVLAVWSLLSLLRDVSLQVTTYEHGVGWRHGRTARTLRFDDIASVREVRSTLVVRTRGGEMVIVPSHVTDREALVTHVRGLSSRAAGPRDTA